MSSQLRGLAKASSVMLPNFSQDVQAPNLLAVKIMMREQLDKVMNSILVALTTGSCQSKQGTRS